MMPYATPPHGRLTLVLAILSLVSSQHTLHDATIPVELPMHTTQRRLLAPALYTAVIPVGHPSTGFAVPLEIYADNGGAEDVQDFQVIEAGAGCTLLPDEAHAEKTRPLSAVYAGMTTAEARFHKAGYYSVCVRVNDTWQATQASPFLVHGPASYTYSSSARGHPASLTVHGWALNRSRCDEVTLAADTSSTDTCRALGQTPTPGRVPLVPPAPAPAAASPTSAPTPLVLHAAPPPGTYRVCYRVCGGDWVQVGGALEVVAQVGETPIRGCDTRPSEPPGWPPGVGVTALPLPQAVHNAGEALILRAVPSAETCQGQACAVLRYLWTWEHPLDPAAVVGSRTTPVLHVRPGTLTSRESHTFRVFVGNASVPLASRAQGYSPLTDAVTVRVNAPPRLRAGLTSSHALHMRPSHAYCEPERTELHIRLGGNDVWEDLPEQRPLQYYLFLTTDNQDFEYPLTQHLASAFSAATVAGATPPSAPKGREALAVWPSLWQELPHATRQVAITTPLAPRTSPGQESVPLHVGVYVRDGCNATVRLLSDAVVVSQPLASWNDQDIINYQGLMASDGRHEAVEWALHLMTFVQQWPLQYLLSSLRFIGGVQFSGARELVHGALNLQLLAPRLGTAELGVVQGILQNWIRQLPPADLGVAHAILCAVGATMARAAALQLDLADEEEVLERMAEHVGRLRYPSLSIGDDCAVRIRMAYGRPMDLVTRSQNRTADARRDRYAFPTATLPAEVALQLPPEPVILHEVLRTTNPHPGPRLNSSVLSLTFRNGSSFAQRYNVSGLADPIRVPIPLAEPPPRTAECVFWARDSEEWRTGGAGVVVPLAGVAVCRATQLSDFAVRYPQESIGLAVLGISLGVCVLLAVAGVQLMCCSCRKRREEQEQRSVVKPQSPHASPKSLASQPTPKAPISPQNAYQLRSPGRQSGTESCVDLLPFEVDTSSGPPVDSKATSTSTAGSSAATSSTANCATSTASLAPTVATGRRRSIGALVTVTAPSTGHLLPVEEFAAALEEAAKTKPRASVADAPDSGRAADAAVVNGPSADARRPSVGTPCPLNPRLLSRARIIYTLTEDWHRDQPTRDADLVLGQGGPERYAVPDSFVPSGPMPLPGATGPLSPSNIGGSLALPTLPGYHPKPWQRPLDPQPLISHLTALETSHSSLLSRSMSSPMSGASGPGSPFCAAGQPPIPAPSQVPQPHMPPMRPAGSHAYAVRSPSSQPSGPAPSWNIGPRGRDGT